jgi:serine protease AprX
MNKKVIRILYCILLVSCSPTLQIMPTQTHTVQPTLIPMTATPVPTQITPTINPNVKLFSDVTAMDLSREGTLGVPILMTLTFSTSTRWAFPDRIPAEKIMDAGKNPGLGVRSLQQTGLTGKGISIAIIDQPVDLAHPEFEGKIKKYYTVGDLDDQTFSMHGPAVTSLLAGNEIGVAPDVSVYYVAAPSWNTNGQEYADALDKVVEVNKTLPEDEKIRAVSISAIPSGQWSQYQGWTNNEAYDQAYQRAVDAGILVLDCTLEHGYTLPCTQNIFKPDQPQCTPNDLLEPYPTTPKVYVPTTRTVADETDTVGKKYIYQYYGWGGLSWSVPYLAGVLAMGWQINPDLTNEQIIDLVFDTATVMDDDNLLINPTAFIDAVQKTAQ